MLIREVKDASKKSSVHKLLQIKLIRLNRMFVENIYHIRVTIRR